MKVKNNSYSLLIATFLDIFMSLYLFNLLSDRHRMLVAPGWFMIDFSYCLNIGCILFLSWAEKMSHWKYTHTRIKARCCQFTEEQLEANVCVCIQMKRKDLEA